MSKHRLDAVFFDLDGTLIDTHPDFIFCAQQLCAQQGTAPPPEAVLREHISYGAAAMVAAALNIQPDAADFQQRVEDFLAIYEANVGHASQLFIGMDTLLAALDKAAIPWGIITNKLVHFAQPLIAALKLNPGCLICPDHVAQPKPDPESLQLACRQLKVKAKHCLYIGDHLRDIEAGRNAGMHTMAAAYGYLRDAESAAEWRADYYAATPLRVSEIIATHFAAETLSLADLLSA